MRRTLRQQVQASGVGAQSRVNELANRLREMRPYRSAACTRIWRLRYQRMIAGLRRACGKAIAGGAGASREASTGDTALACHSDPIMSSRCLVWSWCRGLDLLLSCCCLRLGYRWFRAHRPRRRTRQTAGSPRTWSSSLPSGAPAAPVAVRGSRCRVGDGEPRRLRHAAPLAGGNRAVTSPAIGVASTTGAGDCA